jgi:hypothetical protein
MLITITQRQPFISSQCEDSESESKSVKDVMS